MRSHRSLQGFSSFLTSGSRWHMPRCPFALHTTVSSSIGVRHNSKASSIWLERQSDDYARKVAMLDGLRSRASSKLKEIDDKYRIFKSDQTIVDLGYAPGSWTQVAVERIAPRGRVLGVDVIPVLPPKGASTIQGDFTSPLVQAEMKKFLSNPGRGRPRKPVFLRDGKATEKDVDEASQGYIEWERVMAQQEEKRAKARDTEAGKNSVDVVLSDMLMNVSGMPFRDHAGSMDLCTEALLFCIDVLKPGGAFICKFYQGSEDDLMKRKMEMVFETVSRNKPKSSRWESRENYFIALQKRKVVDKKAVAEMGP